MYFRSGGNMTTITEKLLTYLWNIFQTVYLHLNIAIHNLNKRFEQSGSVADLPQSGRPKSVTME
jgi:hypothetical protein